jgi:uncharacterized lipoprotein YmbA
MTPMRRSRPVPLPCLLAGALLCACLSQNPPAPTVRWFDPSSTPVEAVRSAAGGQAPERPTVTAAPFLRQEFVVRTGPRELAIDELHRWVAPPDRLVAAALDRALNAAPSRSGAGADDGGPTAGAGTLLVHVLRFEFELEPEVRAVVELQVQRGGASTVVRGEAGSRSREPRELAEAMAAALASAAQRAAAL